MTFQAGKHRADLRLASRVIAGDVAADAELRRRIQGIVEAAIHRAIALWSGRRHFEAADVEHDVYLALREHDWRSLRGYQGKAALTTWLFRIAWCLIHPRGGTVGLESRPWTPRLEGEAPPDDSPEKLAIRRERLLRLRAALDELPAEDRLFFNLRVEQEMSTQELATLYKISPDAIRMRKMRMLSWFRKRMGGTEEP